MEPISAAPPHRVERASMIQRWTDAAFLHWRLDPDGVRRLLPDHLHVDVFDGSAWVGLVPFEMRMRLPYAPPVPHLSRYPETNVRTYVRDGSGRRGLWFLSLDVPRSIAVVGARTVLGLPYAWSRMSIARRAGSVRYRAERLAPQKGGSSRIDLPAGDGAPDDSELARFLTARFRMYGVGPLGAYEIDVEHEPWPLLRLSGARLEDDLVRLSGLDVGDRPDHVLVSEGVNVRVGFPRTHP